MKKGLLIILSGPSGAGKGTLLAEVKKRGLDFALSISVTTRAPRENEIDGVHYFFKTKEQVEEMKKNDELLESKVVFGNNTYGTSKKFVQDNLNAGKNVVLEIDTEGALEVKSKVPDSVMIFIVPKDLDTLYNRLVGRGTETAEQIAKRFGNAKNEIAQSVKYDYILINDKIEQCAEQFIGIIQSEKLKIANNLDIIKSFE